MDRTKRSGEHRLNSTIFKLQPGKLKTGIWREVQKPSSWIHLPNGTIVHKKKPTNLESPYEDRLALHSWPIEALHSSTPRENKTVLLHTEPQEFYNNLSNLKPITWDSIFCLVCSCVRLLAALPSSDQVYSEVYLNWTSSISWITDEVFFSIISPHSFASPI